MNSQFSFEQFKKGKIAVCCTTQEEYNAFIQLCEKERISWMAGNCAVSHNAFPYFKSDTAIECEDGFLIAAARDCYEQNGYKILEASDIIKQFS